MLTQEIRGRWNQIRGKVKQKWGQLTEDDLRMAEGGVDEIVGRIQRKTGEARDAIEKFLDDAVSSGSDAMDQMRRGASHVAERAGEVIDDVRDRAGEVYDDVREHASEYYEGARRIVRDHPASTLAAVFGFGMFSGLLIGLMCRHD